ncbi:glycoside hydrolase family 72 protein [Teratosphaeria nubilosa]|uniref:1,3-beta-glucanosyltransferase n=1 Tax=Teratosphaeria nubilosa TaxID=161662 RepID=A0A6G1L4Q7_9PEZI|nr:glycoside hydrolase family 72 protein [Teratosphaeria nubilosa]
MKSLLGCMLAGFATLTSAISPIEVKGSKLFLKSGQQFFIKGVAYQLTIDDPLADSNQCTLDAALMKTLGVNSIRVYHVDPTSDHSGCMSTFSDAGIYAWIDLDTFSTYIIGSEPAWNQSQYSAYQKVMDAFANYDNTAGFFVGNEVLNTGAESVAAPFVKAAIRDMKAYRDSKGYRAILVGYSAADIAQLRPNLQNYLACGGNSSESTDFFGLNAYEWCGDATYQTSGYSQLEAMAENYSVPIFFSETGCNTVEPRSFEDQAAIFGPDMDGTWSGAIIYEWIQETNDYGLISYGPPASTGAGVVDGYTRTGTPTPVSPDFENLSSQWATLTPSSVSLSAYTPTNSPPACPAYTSGSWEVSGNVALPTLGAAITKTAASTTSGGSSATSSGTTSGSHASTTGTSTKSSSAASSTTSGAAVKNQAGAALVIGLAFAVVV